MRRLQREADDLVYEFLDLDLLSKGMTDLIEETRRKIREAFQEPSHSKVPAALQEQE